MQPVGPRIVVLLNDALTFELTVTNIAGPRDPVALAGVPLAGFTAWVPSTGPVRIGLAICSTPVSCCSALRSMRRFCRSPSNC